MTQCCVMPGCKTTRVTQEVTFHKLPLDNPELLEQWMHVIKRRNWIPTRSQVVCSKHFTKDCFNYRNGRASLKTYSSPTIISVKNQKPPSFDVKLIEKDVEKSSQVAQIGSKTKTLYQRKSSYKSKIKLSKANTSFGEKRFMSKRRKTRDAAGVASSRHPKLLRLIEPMILVEKLDDVSVKMLQLQSSVGNKNDADDMRNKIMELESENCTLQKEIHEEQIKNKKLQAKLSKLVAEATHSVSLKVPRLVIAHVKL